MLCDFGTGSPASSTGRQVASAQEYDCGTADTREDCVKVGWRKQRNGDFSDFRGGVWRVLLNLTLLRPQGTSHC